MKATAKGASLRLTFLGGTGTVTGSKYLIEHGGVRLLLDCGLFQGLKQLRLRNWEGLPIHPRDIDAVVLTHAHLDHSGYLPRLVEQGFRGRVHATAPTRDLCALLLADSGRLLEEEAAFANRHGFSRHHPALPLYTEDQARTAMLHFRCHGWGEAFEPLPGLGVRFSPAGHLLGAASVRLEWGGRTLLFSGDLGRSHDLLMRPPAAPPAADVLVVESTYGDREHPAQDPLQALADVVNRTGRRGGMVIVPSFAVGRAQAVLHAIALLKQAGRIPDMPVYLNSPMADEATQLYARHHQEHKLSAEERQAAFGGVHIARTVEESRQLNHLRWPSIIVSASGMATGGRVLHHLKAYAPDERNAIVFAGYQAQGTRGAAMVHGAAAVKIHGEYVPVRAEVAELPGLSGHADRNELLAWMGAMPAAPGRVFITHGEPLAADALRLAARERLGWECRVPDYRDAVELGG